MPVEAPEFIPDAAPQASAPDFIPDTPAPRSVAKAPPDFIPDVPKPPTFTESDAMRVAVVDPAKLQPKPPVPAPGSFTESDALRVPQVDVTKAPSPAPGGFTTTNTYELGGEPYGITDAQTKYAATLPSTATKPTTAPHSNASQDFWVDPANPHRGISTDKATGRKTEYTRGGGQLYEGYPWLNHFQEPLDNPIPPSVVVPPIDPMRQTYTNPTPNPSGNMIIPPTPTQMQIASIQNIPERVKGTAVKWVGQAIDAAAPLTDIQPQGMNPNDPSMPGQITFPTYNPHDTSVSSAVAKVGDTVQKAGEVHQQLNPVYNKTLEKGTDVVTGTAPYVAAGFTGPFAPAAMALVGGAEAAGSTGYQVRQAQEAKGLDPYAPEQMKTSNRAALASGAVGAAATLLMPGPKGLRLSPAIADRFAAAGLGFGAQTGVQGIAQRLIVAEATGQKVDWDGLPEEVLDAVAQGVMFHGVTHELPRAVKDAVVRRIQFDKAIEETKAKIQPPAPEPEGIKTTPIEKPIDPTEEVWSDKENRPVAPERLDEAGKAIEQPRPETPAPAAPDTAAPPASPVVENTKAETPATITPMESPTGGDRTPSPEQTPAAVGDKKPWEMTKADFYKKYRYQHTVYGDNATPEQIRQQIEQGGFKKGFGNNAATITGDKADFLSTKFPTEAGKPVYALPDEGIVHGNRGPQVKEGHKPLSHEAVTPIRRGEPVHEAMVREALARGEKVPPEVLAEYPNLKSFNESAPATNGGTTTDKPSNVVKDEAAPASMKFSDAQERARAEKAGEAIREGTKDLADQENETNRIAEEMADPAKQMWTPEDQRNLDKTTKLLHGADAFEKVHPDDRATIIRAFERSYDRTVPDALFNRLMKRETPTETPPAPAVPGEQSSPAAQPRSQPVVTENSGAGDSTTTTATQPPTIEAQGETNGRTNAAGTADNPPKLEPGGEAGGAAAVVRQGRSLSPEDVTRRLAASVEGIRKAIRGFRGHELEVDGDRLYLKTPDKKRIPWNLVEEIAKPVGEELSRWAESLREANRGAVTKINGKNVTLPRDAAEWGKLSPEDQAAIHNEFKTEGFYDPAADSITTTHAVGQDHSIGSEEIAHRALLKLKRANPEMYKKLATRRGPDGKQLYRDDEAIVAAILDKKVGGQVFDAIRKGTFHEEPSSAVKYRSPKQKAEDLLLDAGKAEGVLMSDEEFEAFTSTDTAGIHPDILVDYRRKDANGFPIRMGKNAQGERVALRNDQHGKPIETEAVKLIRTPNGRTDYRSYAYDAEGRKLEHFVNPDTEYSDKQQERIVDEVLLTREQRIEKAAKHYIDDPTAHPDARKAASLILKRPIEDMETAAVDAEPALPDKPDDDVPFAVRRKGGEEEDKPINTDLLGNRVGADVVGGGISGKSGKLFGDTSRGPENEVSKTTGREGADAKIAEKFKADEADNDTGRLFAVRAWHGSRHAVDKFSKDKIGTGEGAQVYGHGLYFAGRRQVGEYYRNAGGGSKVKIDGKDMMQVYDEARNSDKLSANEKLAVGRAITYLHDFQGVDDAVKALDGRVKDVGNDLDKAALRVLDKWVAEGRATETKGHLYEVDLAPEEHEFLNWDKPLNKQSDVVRAALENMPAPKTSWETYRNGLVLMTGDPGAMEAIAFVRPAGNGTWDIHRGPKLPSEENLIGNWKSLGEAREYVEKDGSFVQDRTSHRTGENLYRALSAMKGGDKAASDYLQSLGVRGIKYADEGSRNLRGNVSQNKETGKWFVQGSAKAYETEALAEKAAEQDRTHNYVVFDDKDIDVLNKYAVRRRDAEGNIIPRGQEPVEKLEEAPKPNEPDLENSPKLYGNEPAPDTTSTKLRMVNKDRAGRGLEPVAEEAPQSRKEWNEQAAEKIEKDPDLPNRLIAEMRETPRNLTPLEHAVLQRHRRSLMSGYEEATDRLVKAIDAKDPAAIVEARAAAQRYEDQFDASEQANKAAGREWGRAGVSQQIELNKDYSLAGVVRRYTVATGEKPTDTQLGELREMSKRALAAEKVLAENSKREADLAAQLEVEKLARIAAESRAAKAPVVKVVDPAKQTTAQAKPAPQRFAVTERLLARAEKMQQAAMDRMRKRGVSVNALGDAANLADMTVIAATEVLKGAAKGADFIARMVKHFGEEARPHITDKMYDDAESQARRWEILDKMNDRVKDGADAAQLQPYLRKLALEIIEGGTKEREPVLDQLHEAVKETFPDITREEVRDALSGYGQQTKLDKAPAKVTLRDINQQSQKLAQLEALEKGQAPLKTGVERQAPNDETRSLTKQVNEAKKKAGIVTTDPESQLKTTLDAMKTRAKNTISDLQAEIDTKQRIVKGKTVPITDAELDGMKKQIAELRKQHDDIFGKPEMSDEQRLTLATTAAKANLESWQERLDNAKKGIFDKAKPSPKLSGPELDALRANIEAAKQEVQSLEQQANPPKTNSQRREEAIQKQIDALDAKIKAGDIAPKGQKQGPDPAGVDALKKQRESLSKQIAELRDNDPVLQARDAVKSYEAQAAEYERKAAAGEFINDDAKTPESNAEAVQLAKARYETAKAYYNQVREADPAYQKRMNEISNQQYREMLARKGAELKDRIARGDFETRHPERKHPLDPESIKAQMEKDRIDAWFANAKTEAERKAWPLWKKAASWTLEPLNLAKSIKAAYDLSAPFRQGVFFSFGHPIKTAGNIGQMVSTIGYSPKGATEAWAKGWKPFVQYLAYGSDARARHIDTRLRTRANFRESHQAGLELTELEGLNFSKQEEAIRSRLSDWIPGIAQSNRTFTTFLNLQRAQMYDTIRTSMPTATPAELKKIASFVNVATGRGGVGKTWDQSVNALAAVLWSPRLMASRFQLITAQPMWGGTMQTRKVIATEYARFFGGLIGVYAAAQLAGLFMQDDKKPHVETDPRSSEFGKIRMGNTRLDPLGGMAQVTVLLSRLTTGKTKKQDGKVESLVGEDVKFGQGDIAGLLGQFARTKLSPVVSMPLDWRAGRNSVGDPVTTKSTIKDAVIPLSLADMYGVMKEQGIPKGAAIQILSMFGMGLQQYEHKTTAQRRAERLSSR